MIDLNLHLMRHIAAMFSLNQGEICTAPSPLLVQEPIYERFIEKVVARVESIKKGDPLARIPWWTAKF